MNYEKSVRNGASESDSIDDGYGGDSRGLDARPGDGSVTDLPVFEASDPTDVGRLDDRPAADHSGGLSVRSYDLLALVLAVSTVSGAAYLGSIGAVPYDDVGFVVILGVAFVFLAGCVRSRCP